MSPETGTPTGTRDGPAEGRDGTAVTAAPLPARPPLDFQHLPAETQLGRLDLVLEDETDYLLVYRIDERTWGCKSTARGFPSFDDETVDEVLAVTAECGWEQVDHPVPWSGLYVFQRPRA